MPTPTPETRTAAPAGLPRTGMVIEAENGRIIVSNELTPEIQEGFRRNPPLDLNREDNRTLAQIATTAFASITYTEGDRDFIRAQRQFADNVTLTRANRDFVNRLGMQYDRLTALGTDLPYLHEPVGTGRTQVMTRDRFIDVVGATTLLLARHTGTGEANPTNHTDQIRHMDDALATPENRQQNMAQLHDRWMENYVNTPDRTTIDNPYEYVAALTAKALGPNNFFANYTEISEDATQPLNADRLTIAAQPPEREPRTATPDRAPRPDAQQLEKKLGGMIFESKARKEENNKVIKAIILMGETFTDFTLAYANLRMFSHLNSIAQNVNNTLMDQDKRGLMHSVSNLGRKLTIMGAVYEYCNTKFQTEREGIRNNKTNGWKLFAGLGASNIALDYVNTHLFKKGLPVDEMFSIPVAPYFYNERPDLKGFWKLFTISEGSYRISATKGLHKVKNTSFEQDNPKTWQDIEKTAGTVRDLLDKLDDGFTLWNVASAVMENVIPDNIRRNWFGGRILTAIDNTFERWAAGAEDISDLAEIPEVLAGLVESYAGMVNESLRGGNTLTGSQSQIIGDAIRRYVANNDSDNDYVLRSANRFLAKLGLPTINRTATAGTPPATPTPTPTPAPVATAPTGTPPPAPVDTRTTPAADDSIIRNAAQYIRNAAVRLGTAAVRAALSGQGLNDDQINRAATRAGVNL